MKDVTIRNMTKFIMTAAIAVALGVGLPSLGSAAYLTGASPVAHLTLDEAATPFADSTGNGNSGTCGTCPTQDTTTTQIGNSQDFTGGGQINIVANTGNFDFPSGTLTISAWVNRPAGVVPNAEVATGRADGTIVRWWIGINDQGQPTFFLSKGSGTFPEVSGVTAINDNKWHHLVGVHDGTTNKLYVDGVLVAQVSQTYSAGGFPSIDNVEIGYWYTGAPANPFLGYIDEVSYYDAALDAETIKLIYNNGAQGTDLATAQNPVIVSDAVVSAYPGGYYYDVDAAGNPAPTYSLSGAPADMTIDAATGEISWIPTTVDTTPVIFTVTATNAGGSNSQQVTLDIDDTCGANFITYLPLDETSGTTFADTSGSGLDATCSGSCPTPEETDKVLGAASQLFDGSNEVTIADNAAFDFGVADDFTISAWIKRTSAAAGADEVVIGRADGPNSIRWYLGLDPSYRAVFYLEDSSGSSVIGGAVSLNDDAWHQLTAVRDGLNDINYLYVDGALVATASADYSGAGFASAVTVDIGFWSAGGGQNYYPGLIDEVALYDVALSVAQAKQNYSDTAAGRTGCNQAPTITTTAGTSGAASVLYTYDADATDPDAGDTLTWSLTNAPSGMTVDASTGVVSWTPASNVSSSGEVTLTVEDGFGGADEEQFTIAVSGSSNSDPVISTTAPTSVAVGGTYTYDADADDSDGDTLSWSLTNAPTGMTVDAATGEVTWTPDSGVTTSGAVTLTVSDGHGGTDTETFTVTVGGSDGGGDGGGGGCFIDTSRASLLSGFHGNITLDNPVVLIILLVLTPFILILARKSRFDVR